MAYAYSKRNGCYFGTISSTDSSQVMVTTPLVVQLPVCHRQIRQGNFQGSSICVVFCFDSRTWNFVVLQIRTRKRYRMSHSSEPFDLSMTLSRLSLSSHRCFEESGVSQVQAAQSPLSQVSICVPSVVRQVPAHSRNTGIWCACP